MSIYRAITLGVLVLFFSNCQQAPAGPQTLTEAEMANVTTVRDSYQAAFNAKDIDALVALYTDDAYVLPPNQEMVQGTDAIRQFLENQFETLKAQDLVLTAVSTYGVGDLAYDVGTASQQVIPPGTSEPVTVESKYLVALEKGASGEWKLAAVAVNFDAPPAPPAPAP